MLWFDLDNSPHVPLFRPIFAELSKRGEEFQVTARDFAQTRDLLDLWQIPHTMIGAHAGANKIKKVLNLLTRSSALVKHLRGKHAALCVSHGSRTQVLAAKRLGIPSIVMLDYEFTESRIFNTLASRLLIPSFIPDERLASAGFNLKKVVRYGAFKEEIYLQDFSPEPGFRKKIGVGENEILITVRPPSTTGNYHDSRSESLFKKSLDHCSSIPNTHLLVINRTKRETGLFADALKKENVRQLEKAVDGLQLLWNSDVVISGGGTMNREAALLGIPTFSIFTGRRPYLDEYLAEKGRLSFPESVPDIEKIPIQKRLIPEVFSPSNPGVVERVVDQILELRNSLQE
jgi:hypothetical protein